MDDIAPTAWTEALDRSLAEITAGQSFPSSQIMAELTQAAEELEASLADQPASLPTRRPGPKVG